ncbi:hypothetical protein B0J14DRAFT_27498 [Halenospora varia]|nr:hypothetical protein B0J14DRAFT_27498 [Halenospora varia]
MFKKTKFEYAPADQDEIEAVNQPLPKRRRNSTLEFVSTWIFQVFLGTLFLLILIFGILRYLQLRDQNSTRLLSADSFFPDFPTVRTKFEETPDFMRFDEIGDQAWNGMIPNGAGYVKVPYPRRYDMEKSVPYGVNGEDEKESEVYQASVVHQLHCLGTLRMVLIAYKNGEKLGNKYDSEWHMSHCLNNSQYIHSALDSRN